MQAIRKLLSVGVAFYLDVVILIDYIRLVAEIKKDRISEGKEKAECFAGVKNACDFLNALNLNNPQIERPTKSSMWGLLIMPCDLHTEEHTKAGRHRLAYPRHNFRRKSLLVIPSNR